MASRKSARRGWPVGLYARKQRTGTYYYYRLPGTRREVALGKDFKAAREAVALYASKHASDPVATALARLEQPESTLRKHADWYLENVLDAWRSKTGKAMAAKTRADYKRMLDTAVQELGPEKGIADISLRAVASFLESKPPVASNRYRSLLSGLFKHAVARGLRADNPADATIKRATTVKRKRLSRPMFDAIRERADPWMQRAMDLALWSLQRREDLATLRVDAWANGELSVRQQKVEGYGTGLLRITPGPLLRAAIIACLNSPERGDCPYLVHHTPQKRIKADWRTHPKQLAPETLTREFARLRDETGMCDDMGEGERPTWHEIRALGGDLLRREYGWTDQQVQALMGHASVEMTQAYLDRHGERWQAVASV